VGRRGEETRLFYICAEKRRSTVLLHPPMCTAFYWDRPDEEVNLSSACVEKQRSPALRSSPMYYALWLLFRRLLAHALKRANCSLSSGSLCDEAQEVHLGEEANLFHVCAEKRRSTVLLHPPMCTVFYWDRPSEEAKLFDVCAERRNDPVVRSSPLVFFLLSS